MTSPARVEVTPARLALLVNFVFAVAVALTVWPLCRPGYLPIEDLPQHIAAIRVLHSYGDAAFGFARYFELELFRTQYLAYYVLADWLSYACGVELANRLLLLAAALSTPYALRYLLRVLGRSEWLALFALPLTYNAHLILGFVNFLLAIPLALFGLALAAQQVQTPRPRHAVGLALVLLLCFFSHVVPFALLALGVLLLSLTTQLRTLALRLWPLAPAGLVSVLWLLASPAGRATATAVRGGSEGPQPVYQPFEYALQDLPNWLIEVLRDDTPHSVLKGLALLLAATLSAGLIAACWRWFRARSQAPNGSAPVSRLHLRLLPLAPLCALLYFVAPSAYDWIWPIAQRFPLLAALLVLPVLPTPPRAAGLLLSAALLGLTGMEVRAVARAFDGFAREEVGDLDAALAAIPQGQRVLGLMYARGSRHVKFAPFIHFVAYYQARKGGAVMFTFADFPQSPFRFREDQRPPRVPPRWEWLPERVRLADMDWYDYVLTRGAPGPCHHEPNACELRYRGALYSVWKLQH